MAAKQERQAGSQATAREWDLVSEAGQGMQEDLNQRLSEASTADSAPPSKPTNLDVRVLDDKSLEIRWKGTARCFELTTVYFAFGGPMINADHTNVMEVRRLAAHVPHPESLQKDRAWVVQISVKAKSETDNLLSEEVQQKITWDDELVTEINKKDLEELVGKLKEHDLNAFLAAKRGEQPRFLLLGPQHHGKSSLMNHLYRFFKCDLAVNDQMGVASAGTDEKTLATKTYSMPLDGKNFMRFIDTPALASMNAETAGKLQVLLSSHTSDGTRRKDLTGGCSWFSTPPHGAIVVISLCHWRAQADEMQTFLGKMAENLKNASHGSVEFPFVVACTHRDVFLHECQKEDPARELQKMVDGIKKAALTEHVYTITNYKKDATGSARNNKATADLLSQLLSLAANENTGKVQDKNKERRAWMIIYLSAVLVALVAFLFRAEVSQSAA